MALTLALTPGGYDVILCIHTQYLASEIITQAFSNFYHFYYMTIQKQV